MHRLLNLWHLSIYWNILVEQWLGFEDRRNQDHGRLRLQLLSYLVFHYDVALARVEGSKFDAPSLTLSL